MKKIDVKKQESAVTLSCQFSSQLNALASFGIKKKANKLNN